MDTTNNSYLINLLKGLEFFLIKIYPFILITLVYTAWFLAIDAINFKPMATVNDPRYFGGPVVYQLHTTYFFIVHLLPVAAFVTARKSIKLINSNKGQEFIWPWILWGAMIITFCIHPAYSWFID